MEKLSNTQSILKDKKDKINSQIKDITNEY